MQLLVFSSLLIGVFQISLGDLPKNTAFGRIDQQCFAELKVNPKVIQAAFLENYKLEQGNAEVNSYLGCVWRKYQYIKENGQFNIGEITRWVKNSLLESLGLEKLEKQEEKLPKIVEDCVGESQGVDAGDKAVKIYNCMVDGILMRTGSV